jgi:hypothetical protein
MADLMRQYLYVRGIVYIVVFIYFSTYAFGDFPRDV